MNQKLFKSLLIVLMIFACIFTAGCAPSQQLEEIKPYSISSGTLSVHFIDVGQGDSVLLTAPNSEIMLIDAGPTSSGDSLVEYLKSQGIEKIDYLVSTHPHEDHIGGMLKVLDNFEVSRVLDPAYAHTTKTFERYLEKIDELDIPFSAARAGEEYSLGDVRIHILWPEDVPENVKDVNEISIVMLIEYNDFSLLLTGDIGTKSESSIIERHNPGKVTVLKVGHHGSRGSSSASFLASIEPEISVISLGEGNSYGHPTPEALERLEGSDIYRTDLSGTILIETDGFDVWVETSK